MKFRDETQNRRLFALLNQTGLLEQRSELVTFYTSGRTASSRELYSHECRQLIEYLSQLPGVKIQVAAKDDKEKADRMRKKVMAICFSIGWFEGNTHEDWKINLAKLDSFLLRSGCLKKPLMQYTEKELPRLVSQFEQIQKHQEQTEAGKAVKGLLNGLNIDIQSNRRRAR